MVKPRLELWAKSWASIAGNDAETLLDRAQVGSLTGKWHFLKLGYGDDTNGFFNLARDTAKLSQYTRIYSNLFFYDIALKAKAGLYPALPFRTQNRSDYFFLRLLLKYPKKTIPPVPKSSIEAGSGTGAGPD